MIKIVESFITEEIILKRNKWENDDAIKHFTTPNFKEEPLPLRKFETTYIESILRIEEPTLYDYLIYSDDELIGECNIVVNSDELLKSSPDSAWVGLLIGEEDYRGKGIGKTVMEFLESECVRLNMKRIELGVFEFNYIAIKLYKALGYKVFDELNDFTYFESAWHKDLRLEKIL